ncbi:MAG TPA: hypothetical protein VIL36_05200 [Acidimicrobiales bacterium]
MATVLAADGHVDEGDATRPGDGPAERAPGTAAGDDTDDPIRPVNRLRDLDRRGRWVAAAFGLAVVLGPLLAFARFLPDWVPSGDPAYMGMRALDVGTSRTPLIGQPSTSAEYVDGTMVHHIGPSHFYLMAPFMRLLGATAGMLVVSVMITGGAVLTACWAVYRQLGRTPAAVAAVVLATTTFTTGASSLVNPVSSNISGYPLLCSAVLLWCVLCGDLRLLPLTTLWVSFTAQQHLAVLPATALLTGVGAVGCLLLERRRLRRLVPWAAWSAGVAALIWLPVVVQELFGAEGNLSQLREFTGHSDRPKLGVDTALEQVVHTLGLPPLLGQVHLDGRWFFRPVSPFTWVTAILVAVVLVVAGVRWARAGRRRATALSVMALAAALAGLLNGSSVPIGIEQYRLPFYHWAFVLTFFTTTAVALAVAEEGRALLLRRAAARGGALAAADPVDPVDADGGPADETGEEAEEAEAASAPDGPPRRAEGRPAGPGVLPPRLVWALGGVALLAMVVPAVVNLGLDRRTNTLMAAYAPVERSAIAELGAAVESEGDRVDGPLVVLSRGEGIYVGLREALALELEERGLDARHPRWARSFVHDDRLATSDDVQGGVVLVIDKDHSTDMALEHAVPGELLADIDRRPAIDGDALDLLVEQTTQADEVVPGPEIEAYIEELGTEDARLLMEAAYEPLLDPATARRWLHSEDNLEMLLEYPPAEPALDPELVQRLLDSLRENHGEDGPPAGESWRLRVYLLDRDELLEWGGWELIG